MSISPMSLVFLLDFKQFLTQNITKGNGWGGGGGDEIHMGVCVGKVLKRESVLEKLTISWGKNGLLAY
jgi:hypothetical protein